MASPVVTPNVSAPAATPVAAPAPIVTPVAAQVAAPVAAPTTAPVVSTETPSATPDLTQRPNETDSAFFLRGLMEGAGAEPTAADDASVTTTELDGDGGAPATEENPAGEEEKPAGEEETPADTEPAAPEPDFDEFEDAPGPLSPKDLNAKLLANPALKEAIDGDPELKNSLFAATRLAAETAAFKDVFINPDEARVAAAGNAQFSQLSDLVTSIEKPEDAQGFYAELMKLSILQDEDGNPILDKASGKPVSDGTVGRLIHHTGALFLNHFGSEAEAKNDPELAAAVDILRARAFGGSAPADQEGLTEEQRATQASLDAQTASLKAEKAATQQARIVEFNQSITTGIDNSTNASIDAILARTDIPAEKRGALQDKIREAVYELVTVNPQFRNEQDELMRRPMGDKTRIARIGLGKRYVDQLVLTAAKKAIAEEGGKMIARQQQLQARQEEKVAASRSEVAGTLKTARPIQPQTPSQLAEQADANLRAKLGRAPRFEESLAEIGRLKSAG